VKADLEEKYQPSTRQQDNGAKGLPEGRAGHARGARDPILDSTPTPALADSTERSGQMEDTSGSNPDLQANQTPLTTQELQHMTPNQRNVGRALRTNTSDSYKQRVEEQFEESLQNKLDKIKDIFNKDAAHDDNEPKNPGFGNPESIQRASAGEHRAAEGAAQYHEQQRAPSVELAARHESSEIEHSAVKFQNH